MNAQAHPVAKRPSTFGQLGWVGQGLQRPECVLATASGSLYTADWRGGVAHCRPDGTQALYLGQIGQMPDGGVLRPNGIALLPDGSFLLAHLGADDNCEQGPRQLAVVYCNWGQHPSFFFGVVYFH